MQSLFPTDEKKNLTNVIKEQSNWEVLQELVGKSTKFTTNQSLMLSQIYTPIGKLVAASVAEKLIWLGFLDCADDMQWLYKQPYHLQLTTTHLHEQIAKELKEYFEGKRYVFSLPLNPAGTPFQEQVWASLAQIPYGQTISYKSQALRFGNIKAIRAVATANGDNPIGIVLPCHRVVGSNGSLTGYAGGLWRKRWLLSHEQEYKNYCFI